MNEDEVRVIMDENELLEKLLRGEVKLHELDRITGDSNTATTIRRKALERMLNVDLSALQDNLDYNEVVGRNCENTIGSVKVPVGIVGPLSVKGEYANGLYFVPIATTEGALVASINRGCAAASASGGVHVRILDDKITRAPVFRVPTLDKSVEFVKWVEENFNEIKKVFESTTKYGRLRKIVPFIAGRTVFLRFEASSGDAMGMNMIVKAVDEVVKYIRGNLDYVNLVSISGNLCTDKKPTGINWIMGRGKTMTAEAFIDRNIVTRLLKTTPEAIEEVCLRKLYVGSARAAALGGFNAHISNIIAGIFLATGQDLGQIVESSQSITYCEALEDGNLYISTTIPALEIGTVGGGTELPTQRTNLSIMKVQGSGSTPGENAKKLAEIITATALAGELSLLAALASHHLTEAHMRLGRKQKV